MKIEDLIILAAQKYGDYDADGADDDAKYSRVKVEDWVKFYNSAQRQLILQRPDANYKFDQWQLTAGQTKQDLPAAAIALISLDRNMGTDGATPGAPVREVDRAVIDDFISSWHSDTGEAAVELYAYSLRTPRQFWVYPRVHSSTAVYVEGAYGYAFTEAAYASISTTDVEADDQFINPILEWMLREAWSIDTDSARSSALAQGHEQAFYRALGIEFQSKSLISGEGGNSRGNNS